jgi:hypothetical protein
MNIRILCFLYIGFFAVNLVSCQSRSLATAIPHKEVEHSNLANSPKLGIAILRNVQKDKILHSLQYEMTRILSKAQENLKRYDWKPNDIIEWIPTYSEDSFDDTHDYLSNPKKNILEIHTTLTYKSGFGSDIFHTLSFSLIPKVFDYNLQLRSYFYDSEGILHELMNTESYSIINKQGKFVNHDTLENNAEQQIQARLIGLIQQSQAKIREKKYSHNNFEPVVMEQNTNPFYLNIDYFSCFNKYQFDYGPGVLDTVVFDSQNYSFCRTELHFYNRTNKILSIDSKDFYLVSNSDLTQALESIPVMYVESRGNGNFLRKNTSRNFSKRVILNERDKPSEESIELFFMLPKHFEKRNVRLRWRSPDSRTQIVEGWIGEISKVVI